MDSLLVNLQKYRPRDNNNPLENFMTEAFAWLLKKDESLSAEFIKWIGVGLLDQGHEITLKKAPVTWSTQENFAGKYPDMVAKIEGIYLVFEHKTRSPLHDGQLQNYKNYCQENDIEYRLILITAEEKQHCQAPHLALCWHQVYRFIDSYLSKSGDADNWLAADFLQLIRSQGMGPPAPISHNAINHYREAKALEAQVDQLINRIKEDVWPVSGEYRVSVCTSWGRRGLQFERIGVSSGWYPCIFVGFILDGYDHKITHRIKEGLKMVLIVSVGRKLHSRYAAMPEFKQLAGELEQAAQATDWSFYNHLNDEHKKRNLNHPLYLEQNMLEFFRGTLTPDEQDKCFRKGAAELLVLLLECPSYQAFLDGLQQEVITKPEPA
jgi:hypothetical protein